jgi:hypothetical protein
MAMVRLQIPILSLSLDVYLDRKIDAFSFACACDGRDKRHGKIA